MVRTGWIEEVRTVSAKYGDGPFPGLFITGIKDFIDMISGKCDERTMIDAVVYDTFNPARSQRKWSRRFPFLMIVLEGEDNCTSRDKILERLLQHDE